MSLKSSTSKPRHAVHLMKMQNLYKKNFSILLLHAGGQLTTLHENLAATCRWTIDHPSWKSCCYMQVAIDHPSWKSCCYMQVDNWPPFMKILLLHLGGQLTILRYNLATTCGKTIDHPLWNDRVCVLHQSQLDNWPPYIIWSIWCQNAQETLPRKIRHSPN